MTSTHTSDVDIIQPLDDAPLKVKLTIHHQFPGIELTSPMYAGDGATCCLPPKQKLYVGSTMQTDFSIDQRESIGILMYKLEKTNTDTFGEATCIQFIVIWKVNEFKNFHFVTHLIEHDKDRV
jgi:hypothetical protein